MKQVLHSLKGGSTQLANVPSPRAVSGQLLIHTSATLVSAGTERMLVEFGKANLLNKARQQPDKVRMVLDKVRTDGLMPTIATVRNKLDQPLALGYCNVGVVIEVGEGVSGFGVGDRVASNGKHAEIVTVPENLCAKIPDQVSDESAAFTVIGAIALQGIRLAQPTLGETFVVTGLGPIGLMAVQLLRSHGCRVLAIVIAKGKGEGTLEELRAAYDMLPNKDALVILVTSKYHTRRAWLTWQYVTKGRSPAITRAAAGDPFDPSRWWRERRFVLSVVREYLGLINYYAGFPVGP